jgi:signal transduction histidine kinase
MRLARKLTIALVFGVLVVTSVSAYLRSRLESRLVEEAKDVQRAMSLTLVAAVEAVRKSDGEAEARKLVEGANDIEPRVDIRWVPLGEVEGELERWERIPGRQMDDLMHGRDATIVHADAKNEDRRYTYVPLGNVGTQPAAALEISQSLGPEYRFIRQSMVLRLVATIGMSVMCALVATTLGYWFVGRPMRQLSEKARRVGSGDLSGRLEFKQRDEIGDLADDINAMCDRLEEANRHAAVETEARIAALEQLRHADRLRTVGQISAGIAHELGTPLNIVAERAEMIAAEEGDSLGNARSIMEQSERMARIIRQLLDFSRGGESERSLLNLPSVVRHTVEMLSTLAEKRKVTIRVEMSPEPISVSADQAKIQQALMNLVMNGIQSMPEGGQLRIRVERAGKGSPSRHGGAEQYVSIAVEDEGEGISADDLPHVFEPFFTTKDIGEGTGLGLAVAFGIVREHGGSIEVQSTPGRGSRFVIYLRAVDPIGSQHAPEPA